MYRSTILCYFVFPVYTTCTPVTHTFTSYMYYQGTKKHCCQSWWKSNPWPAHTSWMQCHQATGSGGDLWQGQGCSLKILKKNLVGTNILLCGYGLNFFHPQEVPFLKQHLIISCNFFGFNTLKATEKSPTLDHLREIFFYSLSTKGFHFVK